MSNYSQEMWGATPPLKQVFIDALEHNSARIYLELQVNFMRNEPVGNEQSTLTASLQVETKEEKQGLLDLLSKECKDSAVDDWSTVEAPDLIFSTVGLDKTTTAEFIKVGSLKRDVVAKYSCKDFWVMN